ncbi:MAG: hypothetical protein ABR564_01955 [Candidatus Dormibacteria bacterium]
MSQTGLAMLGFAAGMISIIVDGRHAVVIAGMAVAVGLVPTAAVQGGDPAVIMLLVAAAATGVLSFISTWLARRSSWVAGLDPLVPAVSPGQQLFGPRSVRVAAGAVAAPAASWASFNVPVGDVTIVAGLLFAIAYIWLCGAARLLVARTLEDLAVATVMVCLSSAVAWVLRGGPSALAEASCLAALAPLAGLTAGWLAGRHHRRQATGGAATESA